MSGAEDVTSPLLRDLAVALEEAGLCVEVRGERPVYLKVEQLGLAQVGLSVLTGRRAFEGGTWELWFYDSSGNWLAPWDDPQRGAEEIRQRLERLVSAARARAVP